MIGIEDLAGIADAVRSAIGKIPDSRSRGETVCMGADGTPTSQIDKIAENAALMYIQLNSLPVNVLSEEIGYVDNGAEEVLVLDPIDGTSNAIAGVPYYTVSMAVGKSSLSDIRLAYLLNPATGDVYSAERGKGAFKNGKRMSVRHPDHNDLFMMIYLGNSSSPDSYDLAKKVKSSRSFGCASLEMALVAEGEADGQFMKAENYSRGVRVVDIAASVLLLREAGGEVFGMDGSPLDMPFDLSHRANFIAVGERSVYERIVHGESAEIGKRYGIYTNVNVRNAVEYTKQTLAALEGQKVYLDKEIAEVMGVPGVPLEEMDVDVVIVIGGDGTLLRALQHTDSLVVGINGGSVGFLSEIDRDHIAEGIGRLLRAEYTVDQRPRLSCWYDGEEIPDAVNEVVIHTASVAKIRHFRVYVDDILAADFRADGIIVSTPTGSTCYAMSLGAPYMDPNVDALLVVPMAPYKYTTRPFVVPAASKITIENVMPKDCLIVPDGQSEEPMDGCTSLDIVASTRKARLIRFDRDFYSRVREKLVNGA